MSNPAVSEPKKPTPVTQSGGDGERSAAAKPTEHKMWLSDDIFCGEREVYIVHGQETYRLLQTKNGKLILQK